jgi:hypothetical protein
MKDFMSTARTVFHIAAMVLAGLAVAKLFGVSIGRVSTIELAVVGISCAQVAVACAQAR